MFTRVFARCASNFLNQKWGLCNLICDIFGNKSIPAASLYNLCKELEIRNVGQLCDLYVITLAS